MIDEPVRRAMKNSVALHLFEEGSVPTSAFERQMGDDLEPSQKFWEMWEAEAQRIADLAKANPEVLLIKVGDDDE